MHYLEAEERSRKSNIFEEMDVGLVELSLLLFFEFLIFVSSVFWLGKTVLY